MQSGVCNDVIVRWLRSIYNLLNYNKDSGIMYGTVHTVNGKDC